MDEELPDLEQLMARLLGDDCATRLQAKQEVQAWSFETAAIMLNQCAAQVNESLKPQSRLRRFLRRLQPPQPIVFPQYFDMLTILIAEKMEEARFARAILLSLARYYAFKRQGEQFERDQRRPAWGSGLMPMQQARIQIDIAGMLDAEAASSSAAYTYKGRYEIYEKPLLSALKRLLPRLEPGQIRITRNERLALLQPLRYPFRDVELTLAVLAALAWAGGEECARTVEIVEQKSIETENGRRIRSAAQSCREQIQFRLNTDRQAQTLLRAADQNNLFAPETLLRPLPENASDAAPEQLLRPAK